MRRKRGEEEEREEERRSSRLAPEGLPTIILVPRYQKSSGHLARVDQVSHCLSVMRVDAIESHVCLHPVSFNQSQVDVLNLDDGRKHGSRFTVNKITIIV